jgi:hypothetical protein
MIILINRDFGDSNTGIDKYKLVRVESASIQRRALQVLKAGRRHGFRILVPPVSGCDRVSRLMFLMLMFPFRTQVDVKGESGLTKGTCTLP